MKQLIAVACAVLLLGCASKKDKDAVDKTCPCAADEQVAEGPTAAPEALPTGATANLAGAATDDFAKLKIDDAPAAPTAAETAVTAEDVGKDGIPTTTVKGFAGVDQTGFRVSYAATEVPLHQQFVAILKEIQLYEKIATALNTTIRLPRTIDIQITDCGTVNAFYDPEAVRLIMCNELMSYFAEMFKAEARSEEELGNAILGATIFAFFHEAGHGLIHQLDLPATGREEDAVDQFATMILIAGGEQTVAMALAGAYWFQKQQAQSTGEMAFADEHSFDGQRFYNVMCMIYGSDPDKYANFVEQGNLTEARAARCPEEFTKISRSWERLLKDSLTETGAENVEEAGEPEAPGAGSADAPPDEPEAPPEPTGDEGHEITCAQVVEKAVALIIAQAEETAKTATAEEVETMKQQLEQQLPAFVEGGLAECAEKNWPDKDRQCILDATTFAQAESCGVE